MPEHEIEGRLGPGVERSPGGPELDAEVDRVVSFLEWFGSLPEREATDG